MGALMPWHARAWLVALAAAMVACDSDDPAGPGKSNDDVVEITGAEAPSFGHARVDGAWRIQCQEPLSAHARGTAGAVATWEGATVSWLRYNDAAVFFADTLSADEVAEFWGGRSGVPVDSTRDVTQIFWATLPFRAQLEFRYRVRYRDGRSTEPKSVSFTFRCEPLAAPLDGEWILSSISGRRLPVFDIIADTLAFLPNVMSTMGGQTRTSPPSTKRTDPEPYRILSATEFEIGTFIPGLANIRLTRTGPTTLTLTRPTSAGSYVWRFDRRGSNPVLPPEPKLAISVTSLTMTAKSGGPMPTPIDFTVTSTGATAGNEIPNLSMGVIAGGVCSNSPCLFNLLRVQGNARFTPMNASLIARTTEVAPGTYTGFVQIVQEEFERYEPIRIPVTYIVTP